MRFLSICSGIEAASVAFHPLGWQALGGEVFLEVGFQVAAPKGGNLETSPPHGSRLGNHMETPFDHMETDWKLDSNRWFPARWKTVRVGYPAKYFGGMPRYATIPMQNLRSPNDQGI
jgi:hypothetical protein